MTNFLSSLPEFKNFTCRQESSYDRSGGNKDYRVLSAGERIVLAELSGAGSIVRIWLTIASPDMYILRNLVIRMYWDDETEASVESPVGDFFGCGFAKYRHFCALPIGMSSGGFYCYIPMPFSKSAIVEIENQSDKKCNLWYHITYKMQNVEPRTQNPEPRAQNTDSVGSEQSAGRDAQFGRLYNRKSPNHQITKSSNHQSQLRINTVNALQNPQSACDEIQTINMPHFHASWRREKTKKGKNYIILDAEGKGHYIGCVLSMQGKSSFITSLAGLNPFVFYFLEGDEMIYVDGESHPPAIHGTGTEDYFNGGFYFNKGVFSAPYHGVTIKDPLIARISAYRFHIEDPIPYESSIKVTIEHGGVNDRPGSDYSSVAYWYQTEPHKTFPELLSSEKRLPVEPYLEHKIKNKFSDLKEIGFNVFEKIGELFNL